MRLPDRTAQWIMRSLQLGVSLLGAWVFWAGQIAMEDEEGPNQLRVPVRIEQDVEAHLYYDVGEGLWGGHVEIQQLKGREEWRVLSFPLPREPIKALRFDPMLTPGLFAIKAPWLESKTGRVIAKFPQTAVVPRHQIAGWREVEDRFEVITWADANDAQVQFELGWPLRVGEPRWPWPEGGLMGLMVVGIVWLARHPANRKRRKWQKLFLTGAQSMGSRLKLVAHRALAAYGNQSSRLVLLGGVIVVCGQIWVLRDLEQTLDLPMWDESNYAARGVEWAADGGSLGDLHTGPGFVVVYGVMSWWGEVQDIVYWQHYWVKVGGTLLLYLVLVRWWQRWPAAMAVALAWGCTWFQSEYPLLVYQSAWMWFLAAVLVIERWTLLGLVLLIWSIGFRQDYQFAIPAAIAAVGWRWWRAGPEGRNLWSVKGSRKERTVIKVIVVSSVVVLGWIGSQINLGGVSQRGWFAFQQHYAVRAVMAGEANGINPLADYPEVMARDFPGATSLSEAWAVNRPAVIRHVRWNFQQALGEVVKLWKPQSQTLLALMALVAAGVVCLLLDAQSQRRGERMKAAGWTGVVLAGGAWLVVGPGLVVLAKGPYLLPIVPVFLLGCGMLVRAIGRRLPAVDPINGAVVGSVTLLMGVGLLMGSEPVFEDESRSRPVAERVSALGEIWPTEGRHVLLAYGASSYANYLGNDRCRAVEPINAVTGSATPDRALPALLEDEAPFAVLVTDDWLASSEIDETVLKKWIRRDVSGGRLYWRSE